MARVACGYLRLTAAEFGALTPREVQWRLEAEQERENRMLERQAQLACWLINPHLKRGQKKLTVAALIERRRVAR